MEHMIYHHEIASQTTSVKYTYKETFKNKGQDMTQQFGYDLHKLD